MVSVESLYRTGDFIAAQTGKENAAWVYEAADTIGAQAMRIEACEAEIKRMESFMKELSDALIKIRPLGGSELFVQRFGRYYADPKYCGDAIEENHRRMHKALAAAARARKSNSPLSQERDQASS